MVVAAGALARALQLALDHDEHQFAPSSALIARDGLVPYRDLPHCHLPYLGDVYAERFHLTDRRLLAARLFCGAARRQAHRRHASVATRRLAEAEAPASSRSPFSP